MFWDVNVGQNISGGFQGAFTVIGKANTFFTSPCPESECHRPLPTIYSPLAVKNAPSLSSLGKLTIWDNTSLLWWAWIYRTWCSLTHLCSILVLVILHHLHASRNFFAKTQKEGKLNLSGIKNKTKQKWRKNLSSIILNMVWDFLIYCRVYTVLCYWLLSGLYHYSCDQNSIAIAKI